jgi:hypothetical protein
MDMDRLSEWELRQRAEARGTPVSGKQFRAYQAWGLLPEQPGGGWTAVDVDRLVLIRKYDKQARLLNRRVILLQGALLSIPGETLRQAMIETIPSIESPHKKATALYRAVRIRYGDVPVAKAASIRLPASWRPRQRSVWQDVFRWPSEEEFSMIAGSVWSDAQSLIRSPLVTQSGLLADIRVEEIVILLMTQQLTGYIAHRFSCPPPSSATRRSARCPLCAMYRLRGPPR